MSHSTTVLEQTDARVAKHVATAQTWAKAILMGEHAVVYGYPAIAIPLRTLRMRAQVELSDPGSASTLNALGYSGELAQAGAQFAGVARAVEVAREFAGFPDYGFHITTSADFPAGRGLGSSAAASGAVIRAILQVLDVDASGEELLRLTHEAEKVSHTHPSGLDALATSGYDTVLFGKGDMRTVAVGQTGYLVIADSGISGSTREAVEAVGRRLDIDHARTRELLSGLGDLASGAVNDLERGSLVTLGEKMSAAHHVLDVLKVSHPAVNRLVRTARSAGALGAKMTGGGLGGCVVALSEDLQSAVDVQTALLADGAAEVWIHPLAASTGSSDATVH